MTRFERDVIAVAGTVIAAAAAVGAALGWLAHQLLDHLHHESPSGHPVCRGPREARG